MHSRVLLVNSQTASVRDLGRCYQIECSHSMTDRPSGLQAWDTLLQIMGGKFDRREVWLCPGRLELSAVLLICGLYCLLVVCINLPCFDWISIPGLSSAATPITVCTCNLLYCLPSSSMSGVPEHSGTNNPTVLNCGLVPRPGLDQTLVDACNVSTTPSCHVVVIAGGTNTIEHMGVKASCCMFASLRTLKLPKLKVAVPRLEELAELHAWNPVIFLLNILSKECRFVHQFLVEEIHRMTNLDRFRDLPEADMKEILHHRMWESNSYQAHEDHKQLTKKKKKRHDSPKTPPRSPLHQPPPPPPPAGLSGTSGTSGAFGSSQVTPPPPPPSTNQSDQSQSTAAPSSSKTAASAEYTTWTTTNTRLKPCVSSIPEELHMDDDTTLDEQVQSSGDEDIGHDHIPTVNLRQNWWKPLTEDILATPEPAWSIPSSDLPFCKKQGITELKQQDLEGPAYEIVKVFHPNVIHLQYQMEECHKLLTDQVDESIIRYNVSKPLPLGGPPGQVTIQSDFFFNKDLEYLRYGRKSGRPALSISKMKAAYYPDVGLEQMVPDQMWIEEECKYDIAAMYGHLNHLPPEDKKILTTTVNLWTRNLVIRQRVEDFQLGIESYQTQLNLTKPRWDATGFEFKHDFTIDEALDYRVKEFKVNRINPGLNTQFWTRKDVDRSKEFMFAIQKRLKTRRIFGTGKLYWWRIRERGLQSAEEDPDDHHHLLQSGSRKDGDGDTSFQWSQFTTPCSHLMLLIKDIMTNERPTTQLPQL
ncbi:hypothetical protein Tco_0509429 [Tanacetum coccineum]